VMTRILKILSRRDFSKIADVRSEMSITGGRHPCGSSRQFVNTFTVA
jgi:hypothetical protein